ncbi:hypothetical protein [Halobacterium sp. KA-6]|uniref:hypothetical protein n=1 Tax=Halobacterium sp. KA-6 TaxID=2896368 RepID=UPI001E54FEF5|nr:hypothetical protein [Halobacterium sp. KA-6]MCD2204378.1 hypothetical protein [Halobacterium sp. KA-6]
MSQTTTPSERHQQRDDELTDDEREVFERLQDYEDDDVQRICDVVLQSSDESEEASS